MFFSKVLLIACISSGLIWFSACSKSENEEISADEILNNSDSAKKADSILAAARAEKAKKAEKFAEPENLSSKKKGDANFAPAFSVGGRFVVQCNVFTSSKAAKRLAEKLTEKGYPAYVAEVENPKPELTGMYYRVRVGNFAGVSPARAFGENVLIAQGYEFWVDNKSNDNVGKGGMPSGGGSMGGTSSYGSEPSSGSSSYTPPPAYTPSPEPAPAPAPETSTPAPAPAAPDYGSSAPAPAVTPEPAPAAPAPVPSSAPAAAPAPAPSAAPAPDAGGTGKKSGDQNFDF